MLVTCGARSAVCCTLKAQIRMDAAVVRIIDPVTSLILVTLIIIIVIKPICLQVCCGLYGLPVLPAL